MKTIALSMLAALGTVAIACSGDAPVNIGSTNPLLAYAAYWDGYAEAFNFADGSDRVRLALDDQGRGTLEVGDAAALPSPTDPDARYPAAGWNLSSNDILAQLRPGFRYPVYGVRVESGRIRLAIDFHDLFARWCALQTPHCQNCGAQSTEAPRYECAPRPASDLIASTAGPGCWAIDETTENPIAIDCVKQALCDQPPPCTCDASPTICQCDATSCSIPAVAGGDYPIKIDGALESSTRLVGTFVVNDGTTQFTIRLMRH